MTLLELVCAFVVLMVIVVPVTLLLTGVLSQSATARNRLTALSLAERCIEKLSNTGPTLSQGVPETGTPILENSRCFSASPVVESTISYNVHAEFTWQTAQGSHPDLCTSAVTPSLVEVQVWATWGHAQKVTDTTLLDYPPPGLQTDGFLAVAVNGTPAGAPPPDARGVPWSTRVQTVPVTITRSGFSVTLHPDAYGCVFEELPAPATYTVKAADPTAGGRPASPAWTSASEAATAAATATVNLAQVTHVTLRFDEGALVTLHYPSTTAVEGPASCPGLSELQCVVLGQEPSSASTPAGAPDAEISVLDATTQRWSVWRESDAAGLTGFACAGSTRCIAVGFGGGAGASHGVSLSTPTTSTPVFGADPVPAGVVSLTGISCPGSTRCYAWGAGTAGAVLLTGTVSGTGVTWGPSSDSLATTPARLTTVTCWSATRCYALGTRGTPPSPVVLSRAPTTDRTWTADTLPSTVQVLDALACPATSTCDAVGRRAGHAVALSLTGSTARKWVADTVPATLTSLTAISCPAKTACEATGTRSATGVSYGALASLSAPTSWSLDAPANLRSAGALTCPSTSRCLALGTSGTGAPVLLWKTGTSTFSPEPVPSSVADLTAIDCPSGSNCFAIGTASGSGSAHAVVLSGTTSWTVDSVTSTPAPVALLGIACGDAACAAPGASETGAVYLDGTPTGTAWSDGTPPGAAGMYVGGAPVAVTDSGLATAPLEVTVPAGTAPSTEVGPLFPFSSGYGIAAGECGPLPAAAKVTSVPGGTASATLPMGLLSVEVVNRDGVPDTGATLSAAVVTGAGCTELAPPPGKTNPPSLTLASTGPSGKSGVVLPYGTYTLTVTHAGHVATVRDLAVSPTSVSATTGMPLPVGTALVVTDT